MTRALRLVLVATIALGISGPAAAAQRTGTSPAAARPDPQTGVIAGRVTSAETGAPLARAEVRLLIDGRFSRLVTTDGDGRYQAEQLPGGEFRVVVSRAGFITLQYGQHRPLEAPRTIPLAAGGRARADLSLPRGGAITGRVVDERGESLAGVRVQVLRARTSEGRQVLQATGPYDETDDTGSYRVYGLPPGDYYVAASPGLPEAVKRDPPVFHPGTPSAADAQPVALAVGGETVADIQIAPARTARVSGQVVSAAGTPGRAMVNLISRGVSVGPGIAGAAGALTLHADAAPNGSFVIEHVPPGLYTLSAFLPPWLPDLPPGRGAAGPVTPESASMPLVVGGEDVDGLSLVTRPGAQLAVRLVLDAGTSGPLPRTLSVHVRSAGHTGLTSLSGTVRDDEVRIGVIDSPFTLDVDGLPDGWEVKSVLLNGADVIDDPIDLKGRSASVRVILSDRGTAVTGTVRHRGDVGDRRVVLFAEDAARWKYPTRYVKVGQSDADGRFSVRGLPPGERYLAAALDYLEDGEQHDPQLLERLRERASSFSLREGEQRALTLDLIVR